MPFSSCQVSEPLPKLGNIEHERDFMDKVVPMSALCIIMGLEISGQLWSRIVCSQDNNAEQAWFTTGGIVGNNGNMIWFNGDPSGSSFERNQFNGGSIYARGRSTTDSILDMDCIQPRQDLSRLENHRGFDGRWMSTIYQEEH